MPYDKLPALGRQCSNEFVAQLRNHRSKIYQRPYGRQYQNFQEPAPNRVKGDFFYRYQHNSDLVVYVLVFYCRAIVNSSLFFF